MEYRLIIDNETVSFPVERTNDGALKLVRGGEAVEIRFAAISAHHLHLEVDGVGVKACVAPDGRGKTVIIRGVSYNLEDADRQVSVRKSNQTAPTEVTPPMPAVVIGVFVTEGDMVQKGDRVVVVTAMKMETTLTAPYSGRVASVNAAEGDKVMPGQILVEIEQDEATPGD